MSKVFVVEFVGYKQPTILERVFKTKEAAKNYKHEHENGKFAAVIKMSTSAVQRLYLLEIIEVLEHFPNLRNPQTGLGCVYQKDNPADDEAPRCVIGEHFYSYGFDLKSLFKPERVGLNPTASAIYVDMYSDPDSAVTYCELSELAQQVQDIADTSNKSMTSRPWKDVEIKVLELLEGI